MITFWTLDYAQHGKQQGFFRDTVHENKLWGRLPAEWNARDDEFTAVKSKCFHFTTVQPQPWQPFPDVLRYEPHPDGEVWFSRERAADLAGFSIFTKDRPSRRYGELLKQYGLLFAAKDSSANHSAKALVEKRSIGLHEVEISQMIAEAGAKSVLDFGAGTGASYQPFAVGPEKAKGWSLAAWPGTRITCYDPVNVEFSTAPKGKFDGVISVDALQHIPEEDIGWVLDEMFGAAKSFVFAAGSSVPAQQRLPDGRAVPCTVQPLEWWKGQFELASKRNPGVRWRVRAVEKAGSLKGSRHFEGQGEMAQAA
jgi:hypothetical protein